jgi:AraC-like DNA-binding protein
MDVLSDVLSAVRLSGSVLFTAEFSAPFGVAAPPSEQFAQMLVPGARRLIMFHLITEGRCMARAGNGEMLEAEAGDMLLMPYGDAFALADGEDSAPCSMFEVMPPLPWAGPPSIVYGGGGASMRLLCGFLHTDELLLQPLLADLPRLIVIRGSETMPRLQALKSYILEEMSSPRAGGASMVQRLVELLFVESLRHALLQRFDGPAPPLAAIGDPIVNRALVALHDSPSFDWTVEGLARATATSRSLLAEQFTRMVGCPPMEYLTRWRMQMAARRMLDRPDPLTVIAESVGYTSDNGFNRTFRRYFGEPPARWRKRRKSPPPGPAATQN